MSGLVEAYQYAVWRVVADAAREEMLNVGVVVHSPRLRYLGARALVDETRLGVLGRALDLDAVRAALDLRVRIAEGDPDAGALAQLPTSERFGLLVAPASTVVRPGSVHTGLCADGEAVLEALFGRLVAL